MGLPESCPNSLPELHLSALPKSYPIASMLTQPYMFISGQIILPDSSPNRTSTYPASHGFIRLNYLTQSLPDRTSAYLIVPGHLTRLPYLVGLHFTAPNMLTRPYPITLPGRVPFNWPHPKTSSSASHLDLGLLLADNASR
jgi:hypothetical protein